MNNVWVGTDWHLWSVNSVTDKRHQFRSISNLGRLSDAYAEDIQSDDIFIYLGDLCDPSVTDIKKLKAIVSSIPGYKVLCKGNHDTQDDTFYKEIGFDVVCEICVIHNLVFSHKPVRVPMGYLNIHGHLHTEKMSTLGYQHINAYDSNFFERPMLVDDLIDSAAFQSPEEYAGTDLKHVEEKFEKYTSVENDTYTQIIDLTDMVGLYPVDEAVELPTFKTPEELFKWMKSNIHYSNFTKLKSSDSVVESKSGSCHDQVVFEYNALKTMGKKPKILFFIAYREGSNQGGMTHSLVYYSEGNKIKWFENSWSGMEGIHTYDSLSDLKADIKRLYSNMPDAKNFPELEFKSASISDFDTGMNLGEFVSGIMDETATDPLDEVLFSDITDVQYWENDDDAPKRKKVKQSPLDTDNQGVVAESTTTMNTFPFIFLSQENMDDELYPEGKMLLRNMDDAVTELYLYQRPAGEYYVHNTEPGYYRIIMSPEFSAGYFSTDTINLSTVGKIRVNADYSWEWIEKYDSDINESIGQPMTEAFFPGAGISLHYAENNIQKTAIQEIKSLIKSNKFKGLNPKPYFIEKNTIVIELVGGSQDERESHKNELAVIAKELKDVLTAKYNNEVKTVTNGDGDEGCIYIKLKKNVDMTVNETTSNKFSAAKSSLKVNTSLYFISKDRLDEAEIIHPRIPDNYMTQHGYEDNKTPRVCFSTSIDGCLTALGMNVSNQKFYVYQPISDAKVITPTEEQVPDVSITKERWICEPVQLHYIGAIKAIDENGPHDDGEPYRYGKNKEFEARLYHWGWKWLNRPAISRNINESASDPVTLYHGSPRMFKIAKVHDSGTSGEHLFATSMRSFALAYAGAEWSDFEINQSRVNGVMYLTEILPGKFREIFSRPGYIHILPADSFKNFHGVEYISDEDVRVKKTYKINNVLKELQKASDVKLYYYPDLPPFIQDRERYLRDMAIKYNHDADKVLSMAKELRVEATESNNPNDGQSSKAVELTFYLGNDKVGEAAVSGYDTGAGFLYDLEVVKRFRGKGYSKQILDYVMKNYSVTDLSVADDNKVAINLYEKFGFKLKKTFNSNGENGYEKGRFRWYQLDESATFNQVKRIVNNIPKEEHHWFYHGDEFKDSPYVKYRDVMYLKNGRGKTIGGFIDVYSFDSDPDTGIVVIALEPGARGTGLATKLVQKALKKLPSLGIKKVIWRADVDNIASQKLAKKLGFTDISDLKANPDQYKYEYVLNEMYLNSLSAAVEDATELHEMSPKDKQAIANKYGLRTPGEYQQDGQDKTQERVNQRREKQLKDLKKARKIKKRKAFVRKVKSHIPGAQNESAMGILSMPKVVSSPPFEVDDKVDLYVGLANKKINEYGKTAKNIPVPKRKFKKNPNKNRAVPDYYLKLWFNPDRASNLLINDAAPNQHTIWLYPDEYCTLMFVCADDVCRVYMLDSYIAGDYHQFLGSFQVDMGIGARLKAALKEDSSGVDDSESDHYEADATDRDPLWGDRNHFFKHPNAADPDIDTSIRESTLYESTNINLTVKKSDTTNPNDPVSQKAVKLDFYDNDDHVGEASISAIDTKTGFLYDVEVFKPYRNKGYGSAIVKWCLDNYKVNELTVEKTNTIAIKLYQKFGFKKAMNFKENGKNMIDMKINLNESVIQTVYKFELVDKNLRFVDRLDEAANKSQKLYPVYVVLVHSGTGVSKAIKAISHSEYSHASICFDSSLDKMYSFARKDPRNPFIGGFRYESIGKGFYEQKEIPYAVYVVPCTENQIKKMKKRLNYFIQNQEKFTFDFTGLVTNYLGIVNNPAHRWFCSRFVADVLNAGAPKNNPYVTEPSLQDPDDFKDTDWAIYVDSGENLMKYDRKKVDRKTNQIIRKEMLRRMTVNESAIFDLDAFNPFIESTLNYQFAMMDEAAVDDFVRYLKSFKVKFDKEGNVIISRREVDQLDKHFRQSLRMIKAYENAGDLDSVKLELCKINYMIELINEYYLSPKAMKSKRVKADLRKEMLDLRSVMLNAFSQHLKYVKTMDPTFNFKSYYDTSIYGKNIEIPKPVLSAIGKAIVTRL